MPKSARVLKFPVRPSAAVYTTADARIAAELFLAEPCGSRSTATWEYLSNADVATAILETLRKVGNSQPEYGHGEAVAAYQHLEKTAVVGVFDERDYFLGETALLAGNTARVIGRYEDAEHWLNLADSAFRHTINPAPLLVRVSHARLVIRYDMRRYPEVLALLPRVVGEYERLGMRTDVEKAKFLEAVTFKELGKTEQAFTAFLALRSSFLDEPNFKSLVLTNIAAEYGRRDDQGQAISAYQEALELSRGTGDTVSSVHLKATIGEAYRAKGDYAEAVVFLRAATSEASENGMQARLAYLRVLLAEALLAAGRSREAEWEALAALPIIEEQKMVAEGFAAIGVLRQSISNRRMDPSALVDLRKTLQAK